MRKKHKKIKQTRKKTKVIYDLRPFYKNTESNDCINVSKTKKIKTIKTDYNTIDYSRFKLLSVEPEIEYQ